MTSNKKYTFEIRQIDAYMYDDSWTWNTSYYLGKMVTSAKNEKQAFTKFLKNHCNIAFFKGKTIIDMQAGGCILEIQDRKTKEPLFAAIYQEQ